LEPILFIIYINDLVEHVNYGSEAFVFFKAVEESWCPSRSTVALLFGSDQACARIRSSCVASLA